MIKAILLFIVGLVLLIVGGDKFVDGASAIAKKFRIPDLIIGATVVSIGTTLPEVMVSAQAAIMGHGEISYGNAVGSVICNTALISAITVAVKPCDTEKKSLQRPVIFFFAVDILYLVFAYFFREFSRIAGALLLATFVGYMIITVSDAVKNRASSEAETSEDKKVIPLWLAIIYLVLGAAAIAIGADLLVDNGTIIAKELGVPESVIALTMVALGTSLPELTTAIVSLIKGHGALSLGNIIGAKIFNLALVSGISPLLSPFSIPVEKTLFGYNASLLIDLPVMTAVMAILTIPPLFKGKLSRWQGITLLVIYAGFIVFQFVS